MTTADERVARWRDTWHKIAASEFAGETVYSHEAFGVVLAALADAETRAALLTRALYAEVRHPINVKGGTWTDDEIRFYLSAKWGLTTPRPDVGQGEG